MEMGSHNANEAALIAELNQLNERSRWYGERRWQMPLAYLAIVGLVASTIDQPCGPASGFIYFLLGVSALLVVWSMNKLGLLEKGAVDKLAVAEFMLGIPITLRAQTNSSRANKRSFSAKLRGFLTSPLNTIKVWSSSVSASSPLVGMLWIVGFSLIFFGLSLLIGVFWPHWSLPSECAPK